MNLSHNTESAGGFADDLVCLTSKLSELQKATQIINTYALWGSLVINVQKSGATARIVTKNGTINKDVTKTIGHIPMGEKKQSLPLYSPHTAYKYMGIWISLDLNWKQEYDQLCYTLRTRIDKIIKSPATKWQKMLIIDRTVLSLSSCIIWKMSHSLKHNQKISKAYTMGPTKKHYRSPKVHVQPSPIHQEEL